jgi:hypothetical protein
MDIRAIFDPARGWNYSPEDISLREFNSPSTRLAYIVQMHGVDMLVHTMENPHGTEWPDLLVVATTLLDLQLDPEYLLQWNALAYGAPTIGLHENGKIALHASFPLARQFPVYLARKQLVTCLAMVASRVHDLYEVAREAAAGSAAPPHAPGNGFGDRAARFTGTVIGRIIKETFHDDR